MRKWAACVLTLGLAVGTPAQVDGPDSLVTILTAPKAQTQLMAMVLNMNAMVPGDIALNEAPATATPGQPPKDATPQGLTKTMMERMA